MTSKDFRLAASIVRAILHGEWTFDTPAWAGPTLQPIDMEECYLVPDGYHVACYTRAVWTAEAFIQVFTAGNDRFSVDRFLVACELRQKVRKAS